MRVCTAIEAKQIAEQQAKQAEYEALKASKEAQAEINRAKGQAEAQRLMRQTLTPELLQKQAIEKWDGQFPQVMSGNGTLPFINISPKNLPARQGSQQWPVTSAGLMTSWSLKLK